jgi:hypothetical protein
MFQELCGEDALQNVILITTMWSAVSSETGDTREAQLRKEFWQPMLALGCRMDRFTFTHKSAWDIVDKLNIKNRRPVKLQIEMVDKEKELSETSAFFVLVRWWERVIAKLRGDINTRPNAKKSTPGAKDDIGSEPQLALALEQKRKLETGGDSGHRDKLPSGIFSLPRFTIRRKAEKKGH